MWHFNNFQYGPSWIYIKFIGKREKTLQAWHLPWGSTDTVEEGPGLIQLNLLNIELRELENILSFTCIFFLPVIMAEWSLSCTPSAKGRMTRVLVQARVVMEKGFLRYLLFSYLLAEFLACVARHTQAERLRQIIYEVLYSVDSASNVSWESRAYLVKENWKVLVTVGMRVMARQTGKVTSQARRQSCSSQSRRAGPGSVQRLVITIQFMPTRERWDTVYIEHSSCKEQGRGPELTASAWVMGWKCWNTALLSTGSQPSREVVYLQILTE